MSLKTDIDQLVADATLIHAWSQGGTTTSVTIGGNPVRSPAKLINDKDVEINVAAGGILAQATSQANTATTQAGIATIKSVLTAADVALTNADVVTTATAAATATSAAQAVALAAQAIAADVASADASKIAAGLSQVAAAGSATSAGLSDTSAGLAAIAANGYAQSLSAALASFRTKYLGAFTTNPLVDGNGGALTSGAEYFNSVSNKLRIFNGAIWVDYDAAAQIEVTNAALSAAAAAGSQVAAQISAVSASDSAIAANAHMLAAGVSAGAASASETAALAAKTAVDAQALGVAGNKTAVDAAAATVAADKAITLAAKDQALAAQTASGSSAAQALNSAGTAGQYSTALAAIASQTAIVPSATVTGFNGQVIASCIYDTRTDSDSGAWRKRCQNTSWYNEATTATGKNLGKLASLAAAWAVTGAAVGDHYYDTTTKLFYSIGGTSAAPTRAEIFRGPRKDYPEIIFWTVEAGRVIGWDATDASFPMWMVFTSAIAGAGSFIGRSGVSAIYTIQGELLIGGGAGLNRICFIPDTVYWIYSFNTANTGKTNANILQRNAGQASPFGNGVDPAIINTAVNSIAATVLPNAPIDPATGLPVPTIAVGTAGGVSVIRDDGTVVNLTYGWGANASSVDVIKIANNTMYMRNNLYPDMVTSVPLISSNLTLASSFYTENLAALGTKFAAKNNPALYVDLYLHTSTYNIGTRYAIVSTASDVCVAGDLGFSRIKAKAVAGKDGMVAAITNAYNSGWMNGDIRGAWLADTVAGTLTAGQTDLDRSVKANPMTVAGTLTKSAVTAGSQLMAYGGFSAANYLEQPYSANLDFGTGDFCVMGWVNLINTSGIGFIFTRIQPTAPTNSIGLQLFTIPGGAIQAGIVVSGVVSHTVTSTALLTAGTWSFVTLCRKIGVIYLYINGVLQGSLANTDNLTDALATARIGNQSGNSVLMGSTSLIRSSATAPTADQIVYIYETERKLFEPGAQCCIAGTSTAVTALDYDDLTDVLHVGTSWGVTEFNGMKAITSYAQAGVTAISAKSGYELISGTAGSSFYKPSRLLAEELTRTFEQRKAFGLTLVPFEYDAIAAQTAFVAPLGYSVKYVYSAGVLKRLGTGKDYTIGNDGFRDTANFAVAPGAAVWVSLLCVRTV